MSFWWSPNLNIWAPGHSPQPPPMGLLQEGAWPMEPGPSSESFPHGPNGHRDGGGGQRSWEPAASPWEEVPGHAPWTAHPDLLSLGFRLVTNYYTSKSSKPQPFTASQLPRLRSPAWHELPCSGSHRAESKRGGAGVPSEAQASSEHLPLCARRPGGKGGKQGSSCPFGRAESLPLDPGIKCVFGKPFLRAWLPPAPIARFLAL